MLAFATSCGLPQRSYILFIIFSLPTFCLKIPSCQGVAGTSRPHSFSTSCLPLRTKQGHMRRLCFKGCVAPVIIQHCRSRFLEKFERTSQTSSHRKSHHTQCRTIPVGSLLLQLMPSAKICRHIAVFAVPMIIPFLVLYGTARLALHRSAGS